MEPLNIGTPSYRGYYPLFGGCPLLGDFSEKVDKAPLNNKELISGALFQCKHYSTSSCWHARYTKPRLTNAQRTTLPGHQHYKLPRLPLDELHNTVNHRKRSADSVVAEHFHAQIVFFGGGAHMWG